MGREIPGQVFNPFFGGNTMEKLIPNTTQIPNIILDCVLPQIPIAEGKCLMYVCRRTFGFHKAYDQISYSQFVNGIVSKDGKRLDYGTGLNRSAVSLALKNLINVGALKVTSNSKGNIYEINLEMDCPEIVIKINKLRQPARNNTKQWRNSCQVVHTNNQSIHHTASSPYTIPQVVVCMDTQKKEKQRETPATAGLPSQNSSCRNAPPQKNAAPPPPFNSRKYLKKILETDRSKHCRIIAYYALIKKIDFPTEKAVSRFIARNSKVATELAEYPKSRIDRAIDEIMGDERCATFNWGLETIIKKIAK